MTGSFSCQMSPDMHSNCAVAFRGIHLSKPAENIGLHFLASWGIFGGREVDLSFPDDDVGRRAHSRLRGDYERFIKISERKIWISHFR